MAILYGYFDESGKQSDHPVVTFSGVCLPQPKLEKFDNAWNALLRRYGLNWLHMARASRLSEKVGDRMLRHQSPDKRMDALIPFADCINEHFELGLIQAMDVEGFNALSNTARMALGSPDDPYYIAFARGMCELIDYVHADDRISVICDDDAKTAWDCYRHYRGIRHVHDEVRKKTVALTFADDKYFPALQAADMVAFLSRLEAKARFYNDRYNFRRLWMALTTDRGVGCTVWKACFADKEMMQALSASFESKPKKTPQ